MLTDIVVVGSLNMDLVVSAPRSPEAGETLFGTAFHLFPGGKGANQAVAASRLGARVSMVGRVGDDPFGPALIDSLNDAGVDTRYVQTCSAASTGVGCITVEPSGQNRIIVVSGANATVSNEDVDSALTLLAGSRLLILQFEIPLPVVEYAARKAHEAGVPVFLNPAPAAACPPTLLSLVDCVVPNELEARSLTGVITDDDRSARTAALRLRALGARQAIITRGERGCVCASEQGVWHEPALPVQVVDTTAAGDAFIGGLAAATVRGKALSEAVRYATCAASLAVARQGAQASLPHEAEVREAFRQAYGRDP
ncbi:MAG TPA: ribokinase [Anaerolineae bacterium]|nr:ribokinase [Anaerolineae bacterium]